VWVFFQSFILMIGGFIAPVIRRITPRAALLGTLAGVSVAFISMRPAMEIYMTPAIGLVSLAIILASWFGGVRYPRGLGVTPSISLGYLLVAGVLVACSRMMEARGATEPAPVAAHAHPAPAE